MTCSEELSIEWSKSCSCSDKTLGLLGFSEDEVSERDHPRKESSDLCIAKKRTSFTIRNTLDNERKCIVLDRCNRIGSIESYGKLEHHILSGFWEFADHLGTLIGELPDIVRELFFFGESKLSFDHTYFTKNPR